MNVLVQGVGGIGGITAGRLSAAGYAVTAVTGNPAIAEALNTHGYRLKGEGGERVVPVSRPALAQLEDTDARYDVVVVATQSPALERALEASRDMLAPGGVVVCFQNGLPEDRAAQVVGRERVLGCVVGWGASMVSPGEYIQTSGGGFQLGSYHPESFRHVSRVKELLAHAAPVQVVDNLAGVRWSKLAINSAVTTMGAIGGDRLGVLMRHRFVRRLALEIFTEVVAVAGAAGIQLVPVNGTFDLYRLALTESERRVSLGSPQLFFKHGILFGMGIKYGKLRSSMLYALERGRTPEVHHLNGEVVRRGEALGVQTPLNRLLVETVDEIAAGRRRSGVDTLRGVYRALSLR